MEYSSYSIPSVGLSTQALELDSLDPDPGDPDPRFGFIVVMRELHMTGRLCSLHCWTGSSHIALEHCHAAQHAALIWVKAVWRQSTLWIRITNPHRIRIQGGEPQCTLTTTPPAHSCFVVYKTCIASQLNLHVKFLIP